MNFSKSLLFFTIVISVLVIFSGCTTLHLSRSLEEDFFLAVMDSNESESETDNTDFVGTDQDEGDETLSEIIVYKTLTLDDIKLELDVPDAWEVWTRRQGGEVYYFIGRKAEYLEFDYSQVPVFSEFYSDPYAMHGVYIQTIPGTMENIELELKVNAPQYQVVSKTDLADGTIIGINVLMKDEYQGYYAYYAIGGNTRPGLKIETRSEFFRNENDEMVFDDEKDKKEIDTIINSIKLN